MVARTAFLNPQSAWQLANERAPLAWWFTSYRIDRWRLQFNEACADCSFVHVVAPRARTDLERERIVLQRRLDESRTRLWPTLRALLMTQTTHQRLLTAARDQVAQYNSAVQGPGG